MAALQLPAADHQPQPLLTRRHVVDVVAAYGKAWMDRDPDQIVRIFTEDALYVERVYERGGLVGIGHDGIRKYWQRQVVGKHRKIDFNALVDDFVVDRENWTATAKWEASFDNLVPARSVHSKAKGPRWKRVRFVQVCLLKFERATGLIRHFEEYWHTPDVWPEEDNKDEERRRTSTEGVSHFLAEEKRRLLEEEREKAARKPYACKFCSASFASRNGLFAHLRLPETCSRARGTEAIPEPRGAAIPKQRLALALTYVDLPPAALMSLIKTVLGAVAGEDVPVGTAEAGTHTAASHALFTASLPIPWPAVLPGVTHAASGKEAAAGQLAVGRWNALHAYIQKILRRHAGGATGVPPPSLLYCRLLPAPFFAERCEWRRFEAFLPVAAFRRRGGTSHPAEAEKVMATMKRIKGVLRSFQGSQCYVAFTGRYDCREWSACSSSEQEQEQEQEKEDEAAWELEQVKRAKAETHQMMRFFCMAPDPFRVRRSAVRAAAAEGTSSSSSSSSSSICGIEDEGEEQHWVALSFSGAPLRAEHVMRIVGSLVAVVRGIPGWDVARLEAILKRHTAKTDGPATEAARRRQARVRPSLQDVAVPTSAVYLADVGYERTLIKHKIRESFPKVNRRSRRRDSSPPPPPHPEDKGGDGNGKGEGEGWWVRKAEDRCDEALIRIRQTIVDSEARTGWCKRWLDAMQQQDA